MPSASSVSRGKLKTRSRILRAIHQADGMTLTELSEYTGLNTVSVKHHVDQLLSDGKLYKVGQSRPRGRPVNILKPNPTSGYLVGIDMDASNVTAIVSDMGRQIRSSLQKPISRDWPANRLVKTLIDTARQIIEQAAVPKRAIEGVGVALTGFYNRQSGVALTSSLLPHWRNVPVRVMLEDALDYPVVIDSSYTAATLAELWYGKGMGVSNFVVMRIRTGVSAGMVCDGDIYFGQGNTGTINSLYVADPAAPLQKDQPRTLSELASGHAILDRIHSQASRRSSPVLWELTRHDPKSVQLDTIVEATLANDPLCVRVMTESAMYWGRALAQIAELMHPQKLILTGSFTPLRNLLADPMNQAFRESLVVPIGDEVVVEFSELDHLQGSLGAAAFVLRNAIHQCA